MMNRPSIADQQELVKESLFQFVRKHIPSAQLSCIDEIVLSYVVSILEDLGTESSVEDAFDVEGFCEMLEAYFPQFSAIHHGAVCQWMFQLEDTLRRSKPNKDDSDICELFRKDLCLATPPSRSSSLSECGVEAVPNRRVHQLSETSDVSSDSSGDYYGQEDTPYLTSQACLLQEMFPLACALEVRHCLSVAEGDAGRAVQLVLHRQEAGLSLQTSAAQAMPSLGQKAVANDEELKTRIINRYSYVDKDDDVREHRPVGPRVVPKKLVRYRDNKIVSLKGERFTDVKKEDDEEMRKTYVSIKPAKQYRFH